MCFALHAAVIKSGQQARCSALCVRTGQGEAVKYFAIAWAKSGAFPRESNHHERTTSATDHSFQIERHSILGQIMSGQIMSDARFEMSELEPNIGFLVHNE